MNDFYYKTKMKFYVNLSGAGYKGLSKSKQVATSKIRSYYCISHTARGYPNSPPQYICRIHSYSCSISDTQHSSARKQVAIGFDLVD